MLKRFYVLIFLISLNSIEALGVQIVRIPANESKTDVRRDYDHQIIRALFDKTTAEFGPVKLVEAQPMTQFRALQSLMKNQYLDIMGSAGTKERETELLAVRHSIHKSLLGIRLFLIKKERQKEFANIKDLSELKKLVAGQAADFPDTEILKFNGFPVITGLDYEGLFRMLQKGRFDYFPRSVGEIYPEWEAHKNKGLVVEETLALVYPYPAYLFVNKNNKALAERLERGWQIILKDGTFEKLFMEKHGESLKRANLPNRRIFFIPNPLSFESDLDFSMLKKEKAKN